MGISSSTSSLTDEEIELVVKTWDAVLEEEEKNILLILRIFFGDNDYISLFQKFKGLPQELDVLENHPTYKAHAKYIMKAITDIIRNIRNPEKLKNGLVALGRNHQKHKITHEHFLELKDVLLGVLKDNVPLDNTGVQAWSKTIDLGYEYIFQGYE